MEKHCKFSKWKFDDNGTSSIDGSFFLDLIGDWERDFHDHFTPFFSNFLFGNMSTMILIKNCFGLEPDEDFGMELINGTIDIDTNLKIESHSKRHTAYAIGSKLNEDEPLFLVIDDNIVDGMVILKYIPDSDEDEAGSDVPVETEKIRTR
jgi:hypothetical protein